MTTLPSAVIRTRSIAACESKSPKTFAAAWPPVSWPWWTGSASLATTPWHQQACCWPIFRLAPARSCRAIRACPPFGWAAWLSIRHSRGKVLAVRFWLMRSTGPPVRRLPLSPGWWTPRTRRQRLFTGITASLSCQTRRLPCSCRWRPSSVLETRRSKPFEPRTVFENSPATSTLRRAIFSERFLADRCLGEALAYDFFRFLRRPQIDRVPQHDGRRHQIEAAGTVALLLETAVADFAQAVEEHGAGQRVARSPLVQPGMHPAAQLDALQPVQDEQRALDTAQLAQRHGQAVLTRIAAELAQHQRGRHCALLDRGGMRVLARLWTCPRPIT